MREVFLVRHGETEWNASGRFQGKLDSSLTENGKRQANAIGAKLATVAPRAKRMIVSPLGRTRQTASIIETLGAFPSVQFDERLAEVTIGSWDGLTHIDIEARWPGFLDDATGFDWYFRSPDGESYVEALARANDWLASIEDSVIAISHGLIGRIIRSAYLQLPIDAALSLPVSQDVIWHMANGEVRAIAAR